MGIEELIEKLEKAEGPSRELDGLIFKATQEQPGDVWEEITSHDIVSGDLVDVWHRRDPLDTVAFEVPPRFTSSVDAALTLVPEGVEYGISTIYDQAFVEVGLNCGEAGGPWSATRKDRNVPIALCIASLKARAAIVPTGALSGSSEQEFSAGNTTEQG